MSAEEPVLTVEAHVFTIDQSSNAAPQWRGVTANSVPVQIFFNRQTDQYRIVSLEGQQTVINHTINSGTAFNKTSQKFGQWTDKPTNSTFGLGFAVESDCTAFAERFKVAASGAAPVHTPAPVSPRQPLPAPGPGAAPGATGGSDGPAREGQLERLKYENEKLKIALATSGKNAKKWEQDIGTLRDNNRRLKEALENSAVNVGTWKKQLSAWKDESLRLKERVKELESQQNSAQQSSGGLQQQVDNLTKENEDLKSTIDRDRQIAYQAQESTEQLKARLEDWNSDLARKFSELSSAVGSMPQ